MTESVRYMLPLLAAASLSGCGLDALEGKPTPMQLAIELIETEAELAEMTTRPCYPVFRVVACDDDGQEIWL